MPAHKTVLPASLSFVQRSRLVIIRSAQSWVNHRIASKGAALSFYMLFSLAPVLILVIAIVGAVFGAKAAQGTIYGHLKDLLGPASAKAIQTLVANARNPDTGRIATLIASLTLLMGATSVFAELKDSLDEIWQVSKKANPSGLFGIVKVRILSFGLVLILSFLFMLSLLFSAALGLVRHYLGGEWEHLSMILAPVSAIFSFSIITILFAVIYKMLPQVKISWRDVLMGALGTACLFTLGKYLIGLYLLQSGIAHSYGAAGSLVALLLWIYYSAQIFFLGAEFTRQYALWFGSLKAFNKEIK